MKRRCLALASARSTAAFLGIVLLLSHATPVQAAGIPVIDALNLNQSILNYVENSITAVQQVAATSQQFYEWAESFVLADLKGTLTHTLQDKIIGFVQGGNGAGPGFVTDWQSYLLNSRSQGSLSALTSISNTDVCDSFRTPLLRSIGAPTQSSNPTNQGALSCDFAPGQIEAMAADSSQGSWSDYHNSFKPQNNFYGAYLLARSIEQNSADQAERAATNEALAGGGFLSVRGGSNNVITTPGSVIKDLTSKAAGSDFDLIANADQLKDLVGLVSSGLISELTSPSGKGISNVDLAARRANRNRTRDSQGKFIESADRSVNCIQVFTDSLTPAQFAQFDTFPTNNPDGILTRAEVDNAIASGAADIDFSLYDLCIEASEAETGNTARTAEATIGEILAKRKKAKDNFSDLLTEINKTINRLEKYPGTAEKSLYKIDNPFYNPDYDKNSDPEAEKFKYAYLKDVNNRICFTVSDDINDFQVVTRASGKKYLVGKAQNNAWAYITDNGDPTSTSTSAFLPGITATTNPAADGGTKRCTVNLKNSSGKLLEVAYYELQTQAMMDVNNANNLAITKVSALNQIVKQAGKSGNASIRGQKVAELVDDFKCHGSPFQCVVVDPTNPALRKQLGCDTDDADVTISTSGYYQADAACNRTTDSSGNDIWVAVPNGDVIPATEMASRQIYGYDTYQDVLTKAGLLTPAAIASSSMVAFNGLISNITVDPGFREDDPSNPYYDPAFDGDEASRVFIYSQGNLDIIGSLQSPDDSSEDGAGDNPDDEATNTP